LGGVDTTKYTGTLSYFPKSTTSPYRYDIVEVVYNREILIDSSLSLYWGVTVASVTYGTTTLATSVQAIVDTVSPTIILLYIHGILIAIL
jgi:hypothetical protein